MSQLDFLPPSSPVPPGESDDWFTPRRVIEPLHREFKFTLDAAGHPESPATQLIGRYFGLVDGPGRIGGDGLKASWAGERVFCNMPYSPGALEAFMKKCAEEWGSAELIVGLPPVRTDRKWWHRYVEPFRGDFAENIEVRFICGRLSFGWPGNPDATGGASARDPSCLVIWRERPRAAPVVFKSVRRVEPAAKGVGFAVAAVKPPTR